MFVSELFYSIQGEGELTGVPSVFIRTSGCNLRCHWCDTKYASWHPEGEERTIPELVETVSSFPAHHCVLTGGEPMVAKDVGVLAAALRAAGKHITIETAGTVPPRGIACDLASLSPKLRNSAPATNDVGEAWRARHEERRLQPEVLAKWISGYPCQLKFVVEHVDDLSEISQLLDAISQPVPPWKVLIMAQGVDSATLRDRDEKLVDACLRLGYRYCHRLHIELFGNQRGT